MSARALPHPAPIGAPAGLRPLLPPSAFPLTTHHLPLLTVDFLILGQGICGTLLSRALLSRGARVLVVADPARPGSSLAAAGIINPVGGKRLWRTQHMRDTLPEALRTYEALAAELSIPPPAKLRLMMFHENEDRRALFAQRKAEEPEWFEHSGEEDARVAGACFQAPHGFGMIQPYYQVDSRGLLAAWRQKLAAEGALVEADFDWNAATIGPEGVEWRGIKATRLIACDGAAVRQNPLFHHLRWTPNKGEALVLSIPGLPGGRLYQHGIRLAPWGNDGLWWAGTRQTWDFADARPTAAWREEAQTQLAQWLRLPFEVADHLAAERPTIAGQQPVAALHPTLLALGIFNGMGSRGFANAPFYAERFAQALV